MMGRASSVVPRTVALTPAAVLTTSAWMLSPGDSRAWVIRADWIAPSAATSAEPRTETAPKSMARLLTEAPSAEGLIWNVALPGLPAAFATPGIGLSTPAGVRSISTSALARDSGALSLIGSGPVSQPRLRPRLRRWA